MDNSNFKFAIGQKVITPFGDTAEVTEQVRSEVGRNCYFVKVDGDTFDRYYAETLLKPSKK